MHDGRTRSIPRRQPATPRPLFTPVFRVRDLGCTHGVLVDGRETLACEIEQADRSEIGDHVVEYLLEPLSQDAGAQRPKRST